MLTCRDRKPEVPLRSPTRSTHCRTAHCRCHGWCRGVVRVTSSTTSRCRLRSHRYHKPGHSGIWARHRGRNPQQRRAARNWLRQERQVRCHRCGRRHCRWLFRRPRCHPTCDYEASSSTLGKSRQRDVGISPAQLILCQEYEIGTVRTGGHRNGSIWFGANFAIDHASDARPRLRQESLLSERAGYARLRGEGSTPVPLPPPP
jgi:hypothetical protein